MTPCPCTAAVADPCENHCDYMMLATDECSAGSSGWGSTQPRSAGGTGYETLQTVAGYAPREPAVGKQLMREHRTEGCWKVLYELGPGTTGCMGCTLNGPPLHPTKCSPRGSEHRNTGGTHLTQPEHPSSTSAYMRVTYWKVPCGSNTEGRTSTPHSRGVGPCIRKADCGYAC